jgi:2,3-bisphosphoglycerate-dependent phosphoglycerate mutase
MPLIYLVRHGETAWNREHRWQGRRDVPLTPLGEAQARAAGRRLAHMDTPAVALYASPLARAWQTAVLIGKACKLEPIPLLEMQEVDVGSWEGYTAEVAAERDPEGFARWQNGGTGWTDGETYAQMSERVCRALRGVAQLHPTRSERVLVVAHGGPIRAIVTAAALLPAEGRARFANGPNGAITVVDAQPDRWVVVSYNDAGHVDMLTPEAAEEALQPSTE